MNPQNNRKELYADLILNVTISDVIDKIHRCKDELIPLRFHYTPDDKMNTAAKVEAEKKGQIMGLLEPWVELTDTAYIDKDHTPAPPIIAGIKREPDFGELIKLHLVVLEHTIGMLNQREQDDSFEVRMLWQTFEHTMNSLKAFIGHLCFQKGNDKQTV
ncbi:hypothetical protein H0G86_009812 [Trichoderma simmonsii]|uniref:Uncharacterized protein n=1 Tax=Trichoderma simmonsii TaxID=1491479 RepID=A0A8G0PIP5_9HYPO|nr:hypothetical protein H0G86_009812 [Trichoderma simmonsii]